MTESDLDTSRLNLQKAWEKKAEDLLDAWFDSYIGDPGDELPNYCEEELLGLLTNESEDGSDYLQLAKDFYEQLVGAAENAVKE